MPTIDFFFDLTCPYCYRGYAELMALLPGYPDVKIQWRPVEAHPKVEEPHHRPWADLTVQGGYFFKAHGLDEHAYYDRIFRAYFDEQLNVEDVSALSATAAEAGADADAFATALSGRQYEPEQFAANEYAYEKNKVWAVPTFVCGDKRLDAVEGVGVTRAQLDTFLKSL